jgi:hypothetical protein
MYAQLDGAAPHAAAAMPAPPACAAASQQRPTIAHEKPLGFDHPINSPGKKVQEDGIWRSI